MTYLSILGLIMLIALYKADDIPTPSTITIDNTTVTQSTTPTTINTTEVEEITMSTTTCAANSTCNDIVNVTTSIPSTSTPKPTTTKPPIVRKVTQTKPKEGCSCNFLKNICDINCCCDFDCSNQDRTVFSMCEKEENKFYDTRYCDYIKYIYINNTRHEWQVNQNGLFCIVSTNFPASYTIQRKQPLETYGEAILQKSNKFSWTPPKDISKNVTLISEFIHGNPVYKIKYNKKEPFAIPVNHFTNNCNKKENVNYLVDVKTSCSLTDVNEDNPQLNFKHYFLNTSVIASSTSLNTSKFFDGHFNDCPHNVCIPVEAKICDDNFHVCVNATMHNSKLDISCQYDLIKNINSCKNVVRKVNYRVYHNGTEGITSVEVLVVLVLVKYKFSSVDYEHYIDFEVNFLWVNKTRNHSTYLSGSPGYVIGKPILTGILRNLGNSTHTNFTINRNPSKFIDNFLVLPKNINGVCIMNDYVYMPVEFGYNLMIKCRSNGQIIKKKNVNATSICRQIQKDILSNWLITENNNISFGLFGNADQTIIKDWWPIIYETPINVILNKTLGNYTNRNESVYCLNIINGFQIDVFHSRVDFEDLINQEKILAITFKFYTTPNVTFSYGNTNQSNGFQVNLISNVMFYDISTEKRKKFVDPPTFEIKLPYDFFYPFIRVHENSGSKVQFSCVIILSVCMRIFI